MKPLRLILPLMLCALVACKPAADDAAKPVATQAAKPDAPATPPPAKPAGIGEVPMLKVTTLDGATFDLADQRGKWVVINYWATWCGPCIEEMPELSALDAMREHIVVVGLAYEDNTPEAMREFMKEHPVVYPIALLDVYNPPKDFEPPRGLPMTYLITPEGKVARKYAGPVTARMLEEGIAEAGGPAQA